MSKTNNLKLLVQHLRDGTGQTMKGGFGILRGGSRLVLPAVNDHCTNSAAQFCYNTNTGCTNDGFCDRGSNKSCTNGGTCII
jgi:hypothetical protein